MKSRILIDGFLRRTIAAAATCSRATPRTSRPAGCSPARRGPRRTRRCRPRFLHKWLQSPTAASDHLERSIICPATAFRRLAGLLIEAVPALWSLWLELRSRTRCEQRSTTRESAALLELSRVLACEQLCEQCAGVGVCMLVPLQVASYNRR